MKQFDIAMKIFVDVYGQHKLTKEEYIEWNECLKDYTAEDVEMCCYKVVKRWNTFPTLTHLRAFLSECNTIKVSVKVDTSKEDEENARREREIQRTGEFMHFLSEKGIDSFLELLKTNREVYVKLKKEFEEKYGVA